MPDTCDENGYTREERERSKSASLKDGSFWAVMVGAGETFVNPFAIRLGADSTFSGILQTVPQFIGALSQLFILPLESRIRNRRLVFALGALLQALVWLPIALLAWLADPNSLPILLLLYIAYQVFGQLINPGWSTWMAELVSPSERGSYFSGRLRIQVLVQMLTVLAAGWVLDHAHLPLTQAFVILFIAAAGARIVSTWFLSRMSDHRPERPVLPAASHAFDWKSYLSLPGLAEGRRFSLYVGALVTGTYISSPFFDIYMLTVLKFDYTTWSILVATQTLAKIFFYTYWGKVVDRFGNRAVLFGTGLLIPAIALFWVFSPSFWWLFFAQIFSGMAWAGFDLASFNYTLSMPDPPTRTAQSAAYSFSKGSGMLLGTLIGGILLALWPRSGPLDPSPFLAVFFISAMARYLASAYFLPRFSAHAFEGRMTGNQFLWEVLAVQPGRSMGRHLMDVSESTMRLAQTGTVHTMWAAEKLGELSAAGFRHAEAQARRTARSAAALGEVPRHSILAARTLGSKLETSSSNLLQYGDVFVAHLARLLSRVQTEAGRLLHSMSKGAGLKRK